MENVAPLRFNAAINGMFVLLAELVIFESSHNKKCNLGPQEKKNSLKLPTHESQHPNGYVKLTFRLESFKPTYKSSRLQEDQTNCQKVLILFLKIS